MSTGDLNGNLLRLLRELRAIKYPGDVDEVGLRLGDPVAFLPLLNFALLKFSRHVARFIIRNGFELAGKTDQRFIESSFRLFRDIMNVRTVLTPAQFFEQGFAERKVLLVCDVIAVCKKLHNEEVRHERLAALKASRQDQVSSRLSVPRRTSPLVKVVRNEDLEIHQVLAPQHLPNATDGAQSVYKTKKAVAFSRSPSLSPGTHAAGKPATRSQSSPWQSSSQNCVDLELTLRPGAPAATGGTAPHPQGPPPRAAGSQAAPPIHTWFLNPAYDGTEEGGVDLRMGLGQSDTGRPDSSAWWRPTFTSQADHGMSSWQGTFPATFHMVQPASMGAGTSPHQFPGGRATSQEVPALWCSSRESAQQGASPQPEEGKRQVNRLPPEQQPAGGRPSAGDTAVHVKVGGGSGFTFRSGRHAGRDVDEWSFSKYFGPGKFQQQGGSCENADAEIRAGGQASGSNDAGGAMEASRAEAPGPPISGSADREQLGANSDDLERDGPAADQDRCHGGTTVGSASPARRTAEAGHNAQAPAADPWQQHAALVKAGTNGVGAAAGNMHGTMEAEWQAKLARLELETQEQLQQLLDKLTATEQELEKTREEARQSRDALQARVTVLEGRVRFLECELEVCVKRQPGQEPMQRSSPAHSSPAAAFVPGPEPSLGLWQSPVRPRSAGSVLQAVSASISLAAGAQKLATTVVNQHEDRAAAFPSSQAGSRAAASYEQQGRRATVAPAWQPAAAVRNSAASSAPGPHLLVEAIAQNQTQARVGFGAVGSSATSAAPTWTSSIPAFHGLAAGQLGGGGGVRLPGSFSPMPQPSFSFQPGSLMQQVASATAGSLGHAPQAPQPDTSAGLGSHVARVHGVSLGSARSSLPYAADTVPSGDDQEQHGARSRAAGPERTRLDAAIPGNAVDRVSATGASQTAAWRAPERAGVRQDGPGGILDGIAAVRTAVPHQEQLHTAAAAPIAPLSGMSATTVSQVHGSQPERPGVHPVVRPSDATYGAAAAQVTYPGSSGALAAGSSGGPGTSNAGSGFRSTDDLINSLYMRYTEAQDFLQTLRKR